MSKHQHSTGLTLIECLLASALSIFLLSVITTWVMHLYAISAALSDKMELDERALIVGRLLQYWLEDHTVCEMPRQVIIEEGGASLSLICPGVSGISTLILHAESAGVYSLRYRHASSSIHENTNWMNDLVDMKFSLIEDVLLLIDVVLTLPNRLTEQYHSRYAFAVDASSLDTRSI